MMQIVINKFHETADLDIKELASLAIEVERLRWDFSMPDEVMDLLDTARHDLVDMVMRAPSANASELSAKLSMLAATNRDDCAFDPALPRMLAIALAEAEALGSKLTA